jgi:hypothetical protein
MAVGLARKIFSPIFQPTRWLNYQRFFVVRYSGGNQMKWAKGLVELTQAVMFFRDHSSNNLDGIYKRQNMSCIVRPTSEN